MDSSGRGYAGVGAIGPHAVQLGPLLVVLPHKRRANGWLFVIVPGHFLDLILSVSLVSHGVWKAELPWFLVWGVGHVDVEEKAPSWQPGL